MAKTTIHSDYIPDNAITSTKIAENSIGAREIATNAITTLYVADGSVSSEKLASNIDIAGTFDVTGATTLDAGLTVDTTTLVVDASNNRVGIGTTSPSNLLHLTASNPAIYMETSGGGATDAAYIQKFSNDLYIYNKESAGKLLLGTNNATKVTLDSSGNVGIGTSIPDNNKLVISDSSDVGIQITKSGVISSTVKSVTTGLAFGVDTSSGNTERMRIDSSGNVGIGATPSSTIRNDITSAEKALQIGNRAMFFSDGGVTTDLQNNSHLTNSDTRVAMQTDLGSLYQQYQGVHKWFNAASVSAGATQTMTERMRIDSSGNVGIGTSSPNYKLEIEGTTDFGDTTTYNNGAAGLISWNANSKFKIRAASNHALSLGAGGTEDYLYILTGGNVGIGTTTPSGSLYVNGQTNIFNGASGNVGGISISPNNTDTIIFNNSPGSYGDYGMRFRTMKTTGGAAYVDALYLNYDGKVGIGLTNPSDYYASDLVVSSATENGITIAATATNVANYLMFADGTTGDQQYRGYLAYGHASDELTLRSAGFTTFMTGGGTERMRIDSSGRLLVDTTSIGNASTNAKVVCDSEFLARGSSAGFFWENRSGMTISSQGGWGGWYSTGTASHFLYSDGANRASIGRGTGTYTALSDVNKKKDFEDSTVGLAEVMQLQPKKFRMLDDADDAPKKLGFIAQDVENVIPEAYVEDLADDENEETFIGLTDRPIIAALTKAIQEQQTIIDDLKSRLDEAGL